MLIKLVNATADLLKEEGYTRLELQLDSTGGHEATYYTQEGCERMGTALPVSDGWEDIATYEGPGDEYLQVWCECEDSGMRWTTVAYRTCYELWFNDLDGYVPAKGYRPLPAPPSEEK